MKNIYSHLIFGAICFLLGFYTGCSHHKCPKSKGIDRSPIVIPHQSISQVPVPVGVAVPRKVVPSKQSISQYKTSLQKDSMQGSSVNPAPLYQEEYKCQYPLEVDSMYTFFSSDSLIKCEIVVNGQLVDSPKVEDNHEIFICPPCPELVAPKRFSFGAGIFAGGPAVPEMGGQVILVSRRNFYAIGLDVINKNWHAGFGVMLGK